MSKPKPIHVHRLEGCRPTPLAHYLKALGIFRLVAEQADPEVRGWWKDDVFHIATTLDSESLKSFFLNDYSPTPILAPWNGGSGFYPKDNQSGIQPIVESEAPRFQRYRTSIATTKKLVGQRDTRPDRGTQKNGMLLDCQQTWRSSGRDWIDAAMTMDSSGEPAFPALLGTGGNDGRLDFTNNFMQRLVSLFDMKSPDARPSLESVDQLDNALWASPTPELESTKIGQFFPAAADGTKVNPWDFILMMEGAIVFRAGISRRCSSDSLPQAAAPFAVRSSGVAYDSSDSSDENARGEQWMPIWSNPSTVAEIQRLFLEGRSQIKKQVARRGTDMARAVSRIGTLKGIHQFQRYGYIERNGLANFAVPIGRYKVHSQPNQKLLDDAAPWVEHFRRVANAKNAPASLLRAHQACEQAIVVCTQRPTGSSFLRLLEAMGQAEDELLTSPKHAKDNFAKPIPMLPKAWSQLILKDLHDDPQIQTEVRLAFSLVAQSGPIRFRDKKEIVTVRHHWLPLDGRFFKTSESGLAMSPTQCANGMDLERALIAIMNRRLLEMSSGFTPLALTDWQFGADVEHIEAFLEHRVDDAKILSIARGLMAVDLSYSKSANSVIPNNTNTKEINSRQSLGGLATYGLLKLAHPNHQQVAENKSPDRVRTGVSISKNRNVTVKCNPMIFRRLQTGDLGKSVELAARQLSIAGLRPRFQVAVGSPSFAKRLAASLGFGIALPLLSRIALGLTAPEIDSDKRQKLIANADST